MHASLYLGMSGLVLPYKNKQYYPVEQQGFSRMSVYGTLFNTIEINSIFYKLPRANTVSQWSGQVADPFRFTFKLSKQITHNPMLAFDPADIEHFFEVISGAVGKKGCILVQFPASVKSHLTGKLAVLLETLQAHNTQNWQLAIELRHASWYNQQTYDLLDEYGAFIVYHDKKGSQSPMPAPWSDQVYLRLHGPDGDYKGSYDAGLLHEYAGYIAEWLADGKQVYVYFNNTMGDALNNLRTLEQFLME